MALGTATQLNLAIIDTVKHIREALDKSDKNISKPVESIWHS